MGTVDERPEPEPKAPTRVAKSLRLAIAGHERGAVRRLVLYGVVVLSFALGIVVAAGNPGIVVLIPGLIAAFMLATTDQLA